MFETTERVVDLLTTELERLRRRQVDIEDAVRSVENALRVLEADEPTSVSRPAFYRKPAYWSEESREAAAARALMLWRQVRRAGGRTLADLPPGARRKRPRA
jgi:hypothetical protein